MRDWEAMRRASSQSVLPQKRASGRPGAGQFALFGAGDFACNLYWQSVSFFLLFFYTDVLAVPPALAGTIYMIGAVWDGVADLLVGILAQRSGARYRRFLAFGALPLGLAFILLFFAPPLSGTALALGVLLVQMVFRSFYALVNVPYVAWSARFSPDSGDRTMLAGLRMLFGTAAALIVATGTPWIALRLTGSATSADGFLAAAVLYALVGVLLLLAVAYGARAAIVVENVVESASIAACLYVLARNRAFLTLNAAAMASGIAAALLTQSVLYYFRYVLNDTAGGAHALGLMSVAGAGAVPLWLLASRWIGLRGVWLIAVVIGLACLGLFGAIDAHHATAVLLLLIVLQGAFSGFHLVFWAMLPNTVEYGQARHGVRVEALAFGVAALLQKIGLALAAGLLGLFYGHIGYVAGAVQSGATIAGIRWLMLYACSGGLALSALAMVLNPLRRDTHAAIVADLPIGD
jgi:GPH family glycoside/pentoside/hexuronide:cation symporter